MSIIWPNFPDFCDKGFTDLKNTKLALNFQNGFCLNMSNFESRAESWKPNNLFFNR